MNEITPEEALIDALIELNQKQNEVMDALRAWHIYKFAQADRIAVANGFESLERMEALRAENKQLKHEIERINDAITEHNKKCHARFP